MSWIRAVLLWLDHRVGFMHTFWPVLRHPVPKDIEGPLGWWYVFGSASMTMLIIQFITGVGLAMVYVPSADKAYESLLFLNYEQPFGWFLRSLHYYAGSAMVVMVLVHMTQVFLHGSYKYPRELTWCVGVVLLICTLGMFFTGQILRWDPDAYWGLAVGGSMAGRVPILGPYIVKLLLGGPIIGGEALSRFFALHVFIIPAGLVAALALHLWLVVHRGISEMPNPQDPVDPAVYDAAYEARMKQTGVPFLGEAILKDVLFSALAVIVVVVIAAVVGPKGPMAAPDPTLGEANPRPEWPFLWLFALLSLSPPAAEEFIILALPPLLFGLLFLVPFVSRKGQRAPSRRPAAVMLVVVIYTALIALTYQGVTSPWSPSLEAWSRDAIPVSLVQQAGPAELQGAVIFQNKNCRNCHALGGSGGTKGPDLIDVGLRLTRDQLIDQVSNGTPGGGEMPAYGKQMGPAEMAVLADFLVMLRPTGTAPASNEPPIQPAATSAPSTPLAAGTRP